MSSNVRWGICAHRRFRLPKGKGNYVKIIEEISALFGLCITQRNHPYISINANRYRIRRIEVFLCEAEELPATTAVSHHKVAIVLESVKSNS